LTVEYSSLPAEPAHTHIHTRVTNIIMSFEVVDNPNCNDCAGAYETAAHYLGHRCKKNVPEKIKNVKNVKNVTKKRL